MCMIHFIDPQSMEKSCDWHREVKENCEMIRLATSQSAEKKHDFCWESPENCEIKRKHLARISNTVWDRFKCRLLVFR